MDKLITLNPRISEKSYGLSQTKQTYIFDVPRGTSKQLVARAVAAQFDVTVTDVNIANVKGKLKRTVRKRSRPVTGQRATTRRAYVTLKPGDSIPVFAALDEANAPADEKPAKKEKK